GKANGDRLLAALHLAAAPGFAALGGAALVTAHFALDFGARTGGIFSAAFLCHAVLLRRNDARAGSVFRHAQGPDQARWKATADGRSFGVSGRSTMASRPPKESCLAASTLTGRIPSHSSFLHGPLC